MKQRHVNTAIQFQKMHAPSVHYMIVPQFNYKLLPPPFVSHSLIFINYNVVPQALVFAVFLYPHTSSRAIVVALRDTSMHLIML